MTADLQGHKHQALVHDHEHVHLTHHCKGGSGGQVEHLVATHRHDHNHSGVDHAHGGHVNPSREHEHEAHIHDHAHPTQS
jgi:hypothetical protein